VNIQTSVKRGMGKLAVALIKRHGDQTLEALRKAIKTCDGFANLKPQDRVVLKPNLVTSGMLNTLPDGVVTPVETVESMITLLREHGCNNITIADGSVIHPDLKMDTANVFRWAGYNELSERLNVPLVDLNKGPFVTVNLEGSPVEIANLIMEADFLINLPVLKTHNQTVVSLGIKNLKGAISYESKKACHRHDLTRSIALLGRAVKVNLTVIDGSFGLQKGPLGIDVHKMNIFVAGKDILEVDIVGSWLLGHDPAQVEYLRIYAELANRSLDLEELEVLGEKIDNVAKPLEWIATWPKELMTRFNIKGVNMEPPDSTSCSGCMAGTVVAVVNSFKTNAGRNFGNIAIAMGRQKITDPEVRKLICLGKCACETNSSHPNIVKVPGCPPSVKLMIERINSVAEGML
jgi:uncharacterized protein (DUF362 family)